MLVSGDGSIGVGFNEAHSRRRGQDEVFATMGRDAVQSALNGFNATIFAYGQVKDEDGREETGMHGSCTSLSLNDIFIHKRNVYPHQTR